MTSKHALPLTWNESCWLVARVWIVGMLLVSLIGGLVIMNDLRRGAVTTSRWPVVQALGRLGDHGWRLPAAVIGLPWLVSKRWSGQNEGVGVIIHGDATVGSQPRHAGGWRVRLVAGGPGHAAGRLSAVRAAPSHAVRATKVCTGGDAMAAQTGGSRVLPVPHAGENVGLPPWWVRPNKSTTQNRMTGIDREIGRFYFLCLPRRKALISSYSL